MRRFRQRNHDLRRKSKTIEQLAQKQAGKFGSSSFDRQQMHDFLERIFDRLAEAGVDDAETTQQYRDWRAEDG